MSGLFGLNRHLKVYDDVITLWATQTPMACLPHLGFMVAGVFSS